MQQEPAIELSIIVPVLNETAELPDLFENLAQQRGIRHELILCDGGSSDATLPMAADLALNRPFTVNTIRTPRGRGVQMNAGARQAKGELLLFLHADSRFTAPDTLNLAVAAFRKHLAVLGTIPFAARFGLSFRRSDSAPSLAYFFYEAKTRLERTDCIRGDQGFMLTPTFFRCLGGFDTTLPFYEDVRLAALIARHGNWLLLPERISTSARRFETEGLAPRQVVNAIIVNNSIVGWDEFFAILPNLYQCHAATGRLRLWPLLEGTRLQLAKQGPKWRRAFWRATGRHVAANIWQLFFWLDVRRAFRLNKGADEVGSFWINFYHRHLERATRNPLMDMATAAAVRVWFRVLLLKSRFLENS